MNKQFWLDDERPAPEGYSHFLGAPALIRKLKSLGPNLKDVVIDLDHDLGVCKRCLAEYEGPGIPSTCKHRGNGYEVLLFLEECVFTQEDFIPPTIKIHTQNTSARLKMEAAVEFIAAHNAQGENSK